MKNLACNTDIVEFQKGSHGPLLGQLQLCPGSGWNSGASPGTGALCSESALVSLLLFLRGLPFPVFFAAFPLWVAGLFAEIFSLISLFWIIKGAVLRV